MQSIQEIEQKTVVNYRKIVIISAENVRGLNMHRLRFTLRLFVRACVRVSESIICAGSLLFYFLFVACVREWFGSCLMCCFWLRNSCFFSYKLVNAKAK